MKATLCLTSALGTSMRAWRPWRLPPLGMWRLEQYATGGWELHGPGASSSDFGWLNDRVAFIAHGGAA
jgi:hypothetical protein